MEAPITAFFHRILTPMADFCQNLDLIAEAVWLHRRTAAPLIKILTC
jgi:hypothetical protein